MDLTNRRLALAVTRMRFPCQDDLDRALRGNNNEPVDVFEEKEGPLVAGYASREAEERRRALV